MNKCKRPKSVNLSAMKKQLQWLLSQYGNDAKVFCHAGLDLISECEELELKKVPIDAWEAALGQKVSSLMFGFAKVCPMPKAKLPKEIDWDNAQEFLESCED